MKKVITIFSAFLVSGLLSIFALPVSHQVKADDDTPVVTLGTSLTSSQRQGTIDTLTQ